MFRVEVYGDVDLVTVGKSGSSSFEMEETKKSVGKRKRRGREGEKIRLISTIDIVDQHSPSIGEDLMSLSEIYHP